MTDISFLEIECRGRLRARMAVGNAGLGDARNRRAVRTKEPTAAARRWVLLAPSPYNGAGMFFRAWWMSGSPRPGRPPCLARKEARAYARAPAALHRQVHRDVLAVGEAVEHAFQRELAADAGLLD